MTHHVQSSGSALLHFPNLCTAQTQVFEQTGDLALLKRSCEIAADLAHLTIIISLSDREMQIRDVLWR